MVIPYRAFILALTVLLAFFPQGAYAADDAFTVHRVEVDVTADSAAEAREQAFNEGQAKAFRALAERLLPASEFASFETPDTATVSSLVQDFEIINEQLSSVRYVGVYTFRFKDRAVRQFFSGRGIAHANVASKPVLVVPFYQWGSRSLLWSDDNPWLAAWKRQDGRGGLVPVVAPIGDVQDMQDINEDAALNQNWSKLEDMRARYGAGEVLLLLAAPGWSDGQDSRVQSLSINLYVATTGVPQFAKKIDVVREQDESREAFFDRAALSVRRELQNIWKEITAVNPQQIKDISMRVNYDGMPEWIEVREALESIKLFDSLEIESMNPKRALVKVRFRGDEQRLRIALSQKDLILSRPRLGFTRDRSGFGYGGPAAPLVYELSLKKERFQTE